MLTMGEMSIHMDVINLVVAILQENRVIIDDGMAEFLPFSRSTGLTQEKELKLAFILHLAEGSY